MMNKTPDILHHIIARKRIEVAESEARLPLTQLRAQLMNQPDSPRGFARALDTRYTQGVPGVIAEIKKASPSQGILRKHFMPAQIAADYAAHGATCLSVLTDRDFFHGDPMYLQQARGACPLPVLRKDFIISPYQVVESRALGADCILLIAACLDDTELSDLSLLAHELSLDVLLEVHDAAELQRALAVPDCILGINNRNLHTFVTDLNTTLDLLPLIPDGRQVVTESGIHSAADIQRMQAQGVNTFLIGEACMRATQPGQALQELLG